MKRLFAIALLLAACSNESAPPTTTAAEKAPATPPAPDAQQAKALIEASPALAEHEFTNAAVSLPVSGAVMSEPLRVQAKQLAAAGWIAFDPAGDIMLSDKSRDDKRFLLRPNGILDIVPLAKKQMGDVTAVRPNPDGTVAADFSWKWLPNEVGSAFTSGVMYDRFAATHDATATFMWDGTAWTVLKVDAR
jgi:hypothetical protein